MINIFTGVGRFTADPVLKKTQSGVSTVSFSLAIDRDIKKEGQQQADFPNLVAWNKTADIICQYCKKGSMVGVVGRVQTRSYDGKDGHKVYVTEVYVERVQLIGGKQENASSLTAQAPSIGSNQGYQQNSFTATANGDYASDTLDIQSDDLPF